MLESLQEAPETVILRISPGIIDWAIQATHYDSCPSVLKACHVKAFKSLLDPVRGNK